jgi:hypothetical protein
MNVAEVQSSLPSFNVPIIGTVDFNNPIEWLFWGGLAVDLIWVSGISKWIIAAGILAARYEYGKYQQSAKVGMA